MNSSPSNSTADSVRPWGFRARKCSQPATKSSPTTASAARDHPTRWPYGTPKPCRKLTDIPRPSVVFNSIHQSSRVAQSCANLHRRLVDGLILHVHARYRNVVGQANLGNVAGG